MAAPPSPIAPTAPGPSVAAPGAGPTAVPSGSSRQATWTGPQGTIVAACSGGVPSLAAARPEVGYRVTTERDERLEVTFVGPREAKIKVTCAGEVSQFRLDD